MDVSKSGANLGKTYAGYDKNHDGILTKKELGKDAANILSPGRTCDSIHDSIKFKASGNFGNSPSNLEKFTTSAMNAARTETLNKVTAEVLKTNDPNATFTTKQLNTIAGKMSIFDTNNGN